MITKYGIKYVLTDEWVVCSNIEKNYLFTADENKIKAALADILYGDGGYDGEEKDFKIQEIEVPEEYDGSNLITDDVYFIKSDVVEADLTIKDVLKQKEYKK